MKHIVLVPACLLLVAFAPAPMVKPEKDPDKAVACFERDADLLAARGEQALATRKKVLLELLKKAQADLEKRGQADRARRVGDYIALLGAVDVARPLGKDRCKDMVERAASQNKYRRLLRVVYVPADQANYGQYSDFGKWNGNSYNGENDIPAGYWVYVYPRWFIWGDLAGQ
jgi:hypothetical protein